MTRLSPSIILSYPLPSSIDAPRQAALTPECCGGHGPEPSKKPNPPNGGPPGHPGQPGNGGGYGGHPGHGGKRDFMGRQQDVIAPVKPFSDLDKLYCPAGLHAWCVPHAHRGG